jgi:hypothetical protein
MNYINPNQFESLAPFIEKDVQINKQTLIQRCTGRISTKLLEIIKLMVFHSVSKDYKGIVYFS